MHRLRLLPVMFLALMCSCAWAQGNYEIQVYGADTVAPKDLMVELHSNFTIKGQTQTIDGVRPTNHQLHETLELTAAGMLIGMLSSAPQRAAIFGGLPMPSREAIEARVRSCVKLFLRGCLPA